MPDELSENLVLDALGNKVRRDILVLLKEKALSVNEIARHFPISRPAISKHLRLLEKADLVQYQPKGTSNIFSLNVSAFSEARAYLDVFWDEALENFKQLAEAESKLEENGS